ncbi:MAG: pyridoxal phosphate-dependent aminotransferase [Cyanobacteria bacterium HKST-UBA01]|nr:pyridoxal phosphate-dependent aminotransferase [Cyanobacteria bacterium HKST-UBA01]
MTKSDSKSARSDNYPFALRLQDLAPSSLKLAAAGSRTSAIDLASGAPLFPTPVLMKAGAVDAIMGDQNQYGNPWGDLVLRQKIAEFTSEVCGNGTGSAIDPERQITITNGSSSALAATLFATINPGDEVLVFEPCYESYISAIKMAGGIPRFVPLNPDDWSIRLDRLEDAFTPKTRAAILNSPHNPTGQIFTADQISYLLDLLEVNNGILISDEIYSNLIFGENRHISPLASCAVDPERVVVINGLSKAYNVSGWRIGWVLASAARTEAVRIVHSTFGLSAPTPLQVAARLAFEPADTEEEAAEAPGSIAYYQGNLDILHQAIVDAGMKAVKPRGGTFILADASNLRTDQLSARDVLLEKTGILTISGTPFFPEQKSGDRYLRFCFARERQLIEEACQKLALLGQSPESPQ